MTDVSNITDQVGAMESCLKEIKHLGHLASLAHWDLEVNMPTESVQGRSEALAFVSKEMHARSTSAGYGQVLAALLEPSVFQALDSTQQIWVQELSRDYEREKKLPSDFVEIFARTTAEAQGIWAKARQENCFDDFAPILKKIVQLNQQKADYLGYEGSPYNALLDLYEPGLTVEQLDPLFKDLKAELVPLVKSIGEAPEPDKSFLSQPFSITEQLVFSEKLLEIMGFSMKRGRLDESVHPFTTDIGGAMDVRLTTRLTETNPLECIEAVMHEGGHGLYEQGLDPALPWPLNTTVSLGIHESQSRLWENLVGKHRAFWRYALPLFQGRFPHQLQGVDLETFYRAINVVKPTLIRIESDEVTYNLHILLRYEIERALIEGDLPVADIPAVWNEKMISYLGLSPETDSMGCLQDVHWSHGSFGYFPTYTLGNLYSAQFFQAASRALPSLETDMAKGELGDLKNWLTQNIHCFGRSKQADAICAFATSESLNAQYFTQYLWEKYSRLYAIMPPVSATT